MSLLSNAVEIIIKTSLGKDAGGGTGNATKQASKRPNNDIIAKSNVQGQEMQEIIKDFGINYADFS